MRFHTFKREFKMHISVILPVFQICINSFPGYSETGCFCSVMILNPSPVDLFSCISLFKYMYCKLPIPQFMFILVICSFFAISLYKNGRYECYFGFNLYFSYDIFLYAYSPFVLHL